MAAAYEDPNRQHRGRLPLRGSGWRAPRYRDRRRRNHALTDIVVQDNPTGQRVTWRQSVTRPLRLNLEFDVVVDGDGLSGESRAGRLPRTRVTGERTTA
jgi:hypothetical protein